MQDRIIKIGQDYYFDTETGYYLKMTRAEVIKLMEANNG